MTKGADRDDLRRLTSVLEAAIEAAGKRALVDAATIAALQAHMEAERSRADRAQINADTIQEAFDRFRRETEAANQARQEAEERLRGAMGGR